MDTTKMFANFTKQLQAKDAAMAKLEARLDNSDSVNQTLRVDMLHLNTTVNRFRDQLQSNIQDGVREQFQQHVAPLQLVVESLQANAVASAIDTRQGFSDIMSYMRARDEAQKPASRDGLTIADV
jgi:hypothetical protein